MKRFVPFLVGFTLLSTSLTASAQDAVGKRKTEARARFNRAIALADEGDLDRALAEFQKAYELLPNPRVLLNIAETQAALGRSADAVTSAEKILADAAGLGPEEVGAAKALKSREEGKVAEVTVTANVAGARVEVDNITVAQTPVDKPLRVSSGQRLVAVYASGYAPARKTVTVAGGAHESVGFELVPLDSRLAHLALKTNLPGARLMANGQFVATTPIPTTLTMAPGKYHFELVRPGYTTAATDIDLGEGANGEVRLEPQLDESALQSSSALLELTPSESNAAVTVDGRARGVASSVKLPPGPHAVSLEKAGFSRYERNVVLTEGKVVKLSPYLVPTAETRDAYVGSAKRTRTLGWILTGGGGAVALTSVALAVVFSGQRGDAQDAYDAQVKKSEALGKGSCGDVCLAEFDAADAKLKSAKTKQTISFVGIGVGAAAAIAGIYFLASGDDPSRYDNPPKSAGLRLKPTFEPLLGGGYGALSGSF